MKKNFLIILIVVLIGACCYILYMDKNNNKSIDKSSVLITENKKLSLTYKEEKYELYNVDQEVVISNKRNLPIISYYDTNVAKKIVNYLKNISDDGWNIIKKQSDDLIKNGFNESVVGINYLFDSQVMTDNYLSISLTQSGNLGGVSWDNIKYYNFSLTNGNLLKFSDITNNDIELKKICLNKVINYINNQEYVDYLYNDNISGKWQEILESNIFESGNWSLNQNGLYFYIEKNLIGPSVIDEIIINIPQEEVDRYLNNYKIK